jgi:hypothetical protein
VKKALCVILDLTAEFGLVPSHITPIHRTLTAKALDEELSEKE